MFLGHGSSSGAVCEYRSYTVEHLLYCGDAALQCESILIWCSEVCTVSSLKIYLKNVLDYCASQLQHRNAWMVYL